MNLNPEQGGSSATPSHPSPEPLPSDFETRLEILKEAFDSVIHQTEYQDEKANRLFTAIAFLSALGGTTYAGILSKATPSGLLIAVHVSFALYVLATLLGAGAVILAVRPSYNIPKNWSMATPDKTPHSIIFYSCICGVPVDDWTAFHRNTPVDALRAKFYSDMATETHLIAQKVHIKHSRLRFGTMAFFASLFPLMGVAAFGILAVTVVG